ncbi:unnamed protein product, partial [Rotaria sordida]
MLIMDDSAGSDLPLLTIQAIIAGQLTIPRDVIVISPQTDLSLSGENHTRNRLTDVMLNTDMTKWMVKVLMDINHSDLSPDNSLFSPLFGKFEGFPPMYIDAQEAGVDITFEEGLHLMYIYPIFFLYYLKARNTQDNNHLIPNDLFVYVNVLIIDCEHDINLHYFENIHYFCIYRLNYESLVQMDSNTLPYLEHLSIKYVPSGVIHLLDTLFSKNSFSYLQSFYINYQGDEILPINICIQAPLLKILRMEKINLSSYTKILLSCPNLIYFNFILTPSINSLFVQQHEKLNKLIR